MFSNIKVVNSREETELVPKYFDGNGKNVDIHSNQFSI